MHEVFFYIFLGLYLDSWWSKIRPFSFKIYAKVAFFHIWKPACRNGLSCSNIHKTRYITVWGATVRKNRFPQTDALLTSENHSDQNTRHFCPFLGNTTNWNANICMYSYSVWKENHFDGTNLRILTTPWQKTLFRTILTVFTVICVFLTFLWPCNTAQHTCF